MAWTQLQPVCHPGRMLPKLSPSAERQAARRTTGPVPSLESRPQGTAADRAGTAHRVGRGCHSLEDVGALAGVCERFTALFRQAGAPKPPGFRPAVVQQAQHLLEALHRAALADVSGEAPAVCTGLCLLPAAGWDQL